MRKVDDGEKKKEKIMTFIVATNVVASRPPKRRPTGTPHARANFIALIYSTKKTLGYRRSCWVTFEKFEVFIFLTGLDLKI